MKRLAAAFAIIVLTATPAAAQAPVPSSAKKNGFGAMLLMTPDATAFRRAWAGPQPPRLNATKKAARGKPVYAMVIVSGCRAAANGKCRVTGQFSVMRPDGKPYQAPASGKIWSGPPAAAGKMRLSEGSVGLLLEPKDPLGTYRVRALVTDHVAGITIPVEQAVTAQ